MTLYQFYLGSSSQSFIVSAPIASPTNAKRLVCHDKKIGVQIEVSRLKKLGTLRLYGEVAQGILIADAICRRVWQSSDLISKALETFRDCIPASQHF